MRLNWYNDNESSDSRQNEKIYIERLIYWKNGQEYTKSLPLSAKNSIFAPE